MVTKLELFEISGFCCSVVEVFPHRSQLWKIHLCHLQYMQLNH
jgi:hypothetical protein